jgi:hypothetical protein
LGIMNRRKHLESYVSLQSINNVFILKNVIIMFEEWYFKVFQLLF